MMVQKSDTLRASNSFYKFFGTDDKIIRKSGIIIWMCSKDLNRIIILNKQEKKDGSEK